jgi:hypothetical protein
MALGSTADMRLLEEAVCRQNAGFKAFAAILRLFHAEVSLLYFGLASESRPAWS